MQKQENMSHVKEKKQSIETVPEEVQTLDLLDKNFKSAILNVLREAKETMSKELNEVMRMMYHKIESINRYYKK